MLLYFVRHGQTDDNANGIIQGHKDTHLNDHGRAQVELVATRLKDIPFSQAWTSELSRAKEGEIILSHHPDLTLQSHPDLKERCLGSMEGKRWYKGWKHPDDVEPSDQFQKRVCNWVFSFLDYSQSTEDVSLGPGDRATPPSPSDTAKTLGGIQIEHYNIGEPIALIVSHGAWMSTLFRSLQWFPFSLLPEEQLKRDCYNTSVMVMRCWTSDPRDVERRKVEYKDAMRRYRAEKDAWMKQERLAERGLLTGMANLLKKKDEPGNGNESQSRGPRPPKRVIETGWDGELLSWGDASHLDLVVKGDEKQGRGAQDQVTAKVADDIKE